MEFEKVRHVYFIGIGGIGMSALARLFMHHGVRVSGTEISSSVVTDGLEAEGAVINATHNPQNISDDVDLVVYTIAIPEDNPELVEARNRGIETITYPQALGDVTHALRTVAVAGTHGKTTTTAMIARIARAANLSPTVIVGSYLKEPRTNFIPGESDLFIVEACEYRRSFLNLNPNILVITNIEADHLDYYRDLDDVVSAFQEMVQKVPTDGVVICNTSDPVVGRVIKGVKARVIDYQEVSGEISLLIPGEHNRENARAALSVAGVLGVDREVAKESVEKFGGTWRRFEFKRELDSGALLYDDYAHHPTEIKATLRGFREKFNGKRINIVFQPHLYSRTRLLFDDFSGSFREADRVFVVPIYAAREPYDPLISSEMLAEKLKTEGVDATFVHKEDVQNLLEASDSNDIWVTMGAGDVYKLGE